MILQIKFENRFKNDNGSVCLISVDGTDCRIREPTELVAAGIAINSMGRG
jgi:hypothetical protein